MNNSIYRPLRVFLCHASADKVAVLKLYHYLRERDIDVWLDQEQLLPGEDWREQIPKELSESDVIVVCLSNASIIKEGYVQKEIAFALDKALEKPGKIFIIPAKLEECDLPISIKKYQWVDIFRKGGRKRLIESFGKRAKQLGLVLPTDALRLYKQARASITLGDRTSARKALKKAIEIAEFSGVSFLIAQELLGNISSAFKAEEFKKKAFHALHMQQWAKAEWNLNYAIDLDPTNEVVQKLLSHFHALYRAQSLVYQLNSGFWNARNRSKINIEIQNIIESTNETIPLRNLWQQVLNARDQMPVKFGEVKKIKQKSKKYL